jgi:dynein heavy chain
LISKNIEAETAVDDLLATIENYKFDPNVDRPSKDEMVRIKKYYFWYFYQALLNST